jgi:trimethylamine--corrinoid protein Co-methyltransferase
LRNADSREPRIATRKENYDAIKILDSLENHHVLGPYTAYFGFEGIPPVMAIPESCAAKIRNSSKVQLEGYSNDSEIFTIQMAKAVGAEILEQILSSSPLSWYGDAIEALFRVVEAGFPITPGGSPVLGANAPVTLAGALVTLNAEILVPLVLAQLIRPGTRVIVGVWSFPMNMRSGAPAIGAIEGPLFGVAFNQIWREYGIPTYNVNCGYVSSKSLDFQSGYEKGIQAILAGVSGANLIGLHGAISAELTFHPAQAIIDDDVAGMVGRFLRGILVNDETLALDIINRVGPIPGHYMAEEQTRKYWMTEHFLPKVSDRLTYAEWVAVGKRTALDYAREKMVEILAKHQPKPLTPSEEQEIEKILEECRKYYKKNGKL